MEVTLANVTTPQSLLFGLVLRRLVDQRRLPKRPFQLWILDHALEIRKRLRVLIAPCLVLGVSVSKDRSEGKIRKGEAIADEVLALGRPNCRC